MSKKIKTFSGVEWQLSSLYNQIVIGILVVLVGLLILNCRTKQEHATFNKSVVSNDSLTAKSIDNQLLKKQSAHLSETIEFNGNTFHVFLVSIKNNGLRLFLNNRSGKNYSNFQAIKAYLQTDEKKNLVFAMNAGMFHANHQPVGLYIENKKILHPVNVDTSSRGNFFMQPNGIFAFSGDNAAVLPTFEFIKNYSSPDVFDFATQSGPMLVIDGRINPKFNAQSTSKFVRNAVGIRDDTIVFAISNEPVNFYDISSFLLDKMNCRSALFLDGSISRMYLPELNLNELSGEFGPMIALQAE